jgi:hypothetical protein
MEFIDNSDHGRELQSASSFEGRGECYNPTEAGSLKDGNGETSASHVERLFVQGRSFETVTRMAFWVGPGETSPGCHGAISRVPRPLSDHILKKKITIGADNMPNAIAHDITFVVPTPHSQGVFEALTGYMNPAFSTFWTLDPSTATLRPLDHQAGEQTLPVIFSTADKTHAMGVYCPGRIGGQGPTYGRFDFGNGHHPTVKWNAVYRLKDVPAGEYQFQCVTFVGTLDDARTAMVQYAGRRRP